MRPDARDRPLASGGLLIARLVVGGVWLWAGGAKLTDVSASQQAVRAYQLLPWRLADVVGAALPAVEVALGLLLVAGLATRVAGALSALLMAAFVVGIASAWARGLTIDCGCFGGGGFDPDAASKYPWEIARDSGLLALSLALAWWGAGRWGLDRRLWHDEGE